MRVLIDVRPAASCGTGIGRYARMLAEVTREPIPGHACAAADGQRLRFGSVIEEELGLPALLARERAELFHSPLFHLPALLGDAAAVVTIHDAAPVLHPELTTPAFARLFERAAQAAARAALVVCPTETARQEVVQALSLPANKVRVVPEAPSPVFADASEGPQTPGEPYLLVVGSLEARKNPALVLDALALAPELPPAVFVGPEAGFDLLSEAERRGVRARVRVEGWLPDRELARLYRSATALLFPSRYEGFGLPLVEAFASGLPVVSSRAGSLPEVAGDAALLVDPDDAQGLAEATRLLVADPALRTELVARGRRRVEERYSLAVVSRGLAGAWDQVAHERSVAA